MHDSHQVPYTCVATTAFLPCCGLWPLLPSRLLFWPQTTFCGMGTCLFQGCKPFNHNTETVPNIRYVYYVYAHDPVVGLSDDGCSVKSDFLGVVTVCDFLVTFKPNNNAASRLKCRTATSLHAHCFYCFCCCCCCRLCRCLR